MTQHNDWKDESRFNEKLNKNNLKRFAVLVHFEISKPFCYTKAPEIAEISGAYSYLPLSVGTYA